MTLPSLSRMPAALAFVLAASVFGLIGGGCSGSGGTSTTPKGEFTIESISVLQHQEWKINRPIDIVFSRDVDFSTVSQNTIRISDPLGNAATGIFSQPMDTNGKADPRKVRFQPNCPTRDDNSDAGLLPGTAYRLAVYGSKTGGTTVKSTLGHTLTQGALVDFTTPDTDNPLELFIDTVPGPPNVRLRGLPGISSTDEAATHVEIGGEKVYFQLTNQQGRLPANFKVPLNHYSIPENRVAVVIHFNQPVSPKSSNVNSSLLEFEYLDGASWEPVQTQVELIENCTETGAAVRVTPLGILPQGAELRMNMHLGFADLTGDKTTADITNFARMDAALEGDANPLFPEVGNPGADERLEQFVLVGNEVGSLEDTTAAFTVPRADWEDDTLTASFDFDGTGGPGGDFDWHLPGGVELILNTVSDTIIGGPGGVPETTQSVINGVIDVRDLYIPEDARLIIQGPNPCTILASGNVTIEGEISVRGSDSQGVGTLNTTNQPEPGAPGQAGGGDGGVGSYLTTQSTPRGGRGNGAFNTPNGGGQGGETSYSNAGKINRRGSGGGGGRFGPDTYFLWEGDPARVQTLVGLDAEPGAPGGPLGLGAQSQSERAQGGAIGPEPFIDEDPDNNFFGIMRTADDTVIFGELSGVWGGAGGGAGGDAVNSDSFPLTPWDPTGDEKGSGGGGGAGGLRILAIGTITIGQSGGIVGSLAAEGGDGGGGENTNFFDRVGGGSGGGAGGHIVLSTAASITVHGVATNADDWYSDNDALASHKARPISAVGGQGGAGNNSTGGANENGPTGWACDSIPLSFFGTNQQPPRQKACFTAHPDISDESGFPVVGAGGDGSPGIVQLHVENPATDLDFPDIPAPKNYLLGADVSYVSAPPPLGWNGPGETPDVMVPFFGRKSAAQSKWIPLGLARAAAGGGTQPVTLRFEGTDGAGDVPRDGTLVDQLAPIIGPDALGSTGNPPYIAEAGFAMVFDSTQLTGENTIYLENPALLRNFSVRLTDTGDAENFRLFTIASASPDAGNLLTCRLAADQDPLSSFSAQGGIEVELIPHFVRVLSSGIVDLYPDNTAVNILWDATVLDTVTGLPSVTESYSAGNGGDLTADIDDLNPAMDWDFVRWQVNFDLSTNDDPVDFGSPRPGIDLLRFTFRF